MGLIDASLSEKERCTIHRSHAAAWTFSQNPNSYSHVRSSSRTWLQFRLVPLGLMGEHGCNLIEIKHSIINWQQVAP